MNPSISARFSTCLLAGLLATGSVLLPTTAQVQAQARHQPDASRAQQWRAELKSRFSAADTDSNGRLTRDEAKGKMPLVFKYFDRIDAVGKGSVTIADIESFAVATLSLRNAAK